MDEPLRVGIAGLGFGSTEFLPVLERMPQVKLVAGADLRPQALEAFRSRYGGTTYDNVGRALRRSPGRGGLDLDAESAPRGACSGSRAPWKAHGGA